MFNPDGLNKLGEIFELACVIFCGIMFLGVFSVFLLMIIFAAPGYVAFVAMLFVFAAFLATIVVMVTGKSS